MTQPINNVINAGIFGMIISEINPVKAMPKQIKNFALFSLKEINNKAAPKDAAISEKVAT